LILYQTIRPELGTPAQGSKLAGKPTEEQLDQEKPIALQYGLNDSASGSEEEVSPSSTRKPHLT
jgi:hypothetical protein